MARVTIELGGSAKPVTFEVRYAVARAVLTLLMPQKLYGKTFSQVFVDNFLDKYSLQAERGKNDNTSNSD